MARTAKTKDQPATEPAPATNATEAGAHAANPAPRPGSKLASVVDLLESAEGATIAEIMAATGWQQHTVRGALAGSITKKLGRALSSEKVEGRGRVYLTASGRTERQTIRWSKRLHARSGGSACLSPASSPPSPNCPIAKGSHRPT